MSRAREIAVALDGTGRIESGGRYRCRCPVHGDATTPSMTVKDDPSRRDGIDVKCWSQNCDPLAIKRELARRGLMNGTPGELRPIDPKIAERIAAERRAEQNKRRELAGWLWNKAEPGKQARELTRYLSECRGIDLERIGGVPDCLRYEIDAAIPMTEPQQFGMAMVAAVTDALGELTAIHSTFLNWSGSAKASLDDDKFIIGPPAGGAVRLFPVAVELGIAEGIETALSAAELTGVPTWAALNTSCLVAFMVPPAVRRVLIFADFDPVKANGKRPGTIAAETLAERLTQQCIHCEIRYPSGGLNDFNDELQQRKREARAA